MRSLKEKRIILAITGSIAAYKAAFLTRLLIKSGAEVRVIMTPGSTRFIAPLTLSTLSKHKVFTEVIGEESWNNHVEMGLWADAMIVAPATANSIGKLANGLCDTIVAAVYLSARCPVFLAPAMDVDMWKHPAVQNNLSKLVAAGNRIVPVGRGELASGLVGEGRMAEPEEIVAFLAKFFAADQDLRNKKIVITAGPTHEPIDPVRFVGNRSSGKMGIAIAEAAHRRGAEVKLVLGPTSMDTDLVPVFKVRTAQEMFEETIRHFVDCDVAILAAAVADYRPEHVSNQKIKKKSNTLRLDLIKNPDIAAELGTRKKGEQVTIGFALETNDEEENAFGKLQKKNFDFIVLNSLKEEGAGFAHDTNKITILGKDGSKKSYPLKPKTEVAEDILDALVALQI